MTDADQQLKEIKQALTVTERIIRQLKAECVLPHYMEGLEGALTSILNNCVLTLAERKDDPTLLPWIIERCKGVLGEKAVTQ